MTKGWLCAPSCPIRLLDEQAGDLSTCGGPKKTHGSGGLYEMGSAGAPGAIYRDSGGPSRFFQTFPPETEDNLIEPVQETSVQILRGDCRDRLKELPDNSIDSVVTDPPYGLSKQPDIAEVMRHWLNGDDYEHKGGGFMSAAWDSFVPGPSYWSEVYRVMKPGAHLLCLSGTRTWDLMSMALRFAGFENRDTISNEGPPALRWVYGSGFPKSHDISKAIDKMRNDKIEHVCEFLRQAIEVSPTSRKDIGGHFGLNPRQVDQWAPRPTDNSSKERMHIPTWEQWLQLKDLLGFSDEMDAEVWRLNGRKGKPGEAWHEREVVGKNSHGASNGSVVGLGSPRAMATEYDITAPATEEAKRWEGWGSALKPAWEVILVFRKPLTEKNLASNVLKHSTGGINVEASRVDGKRFPANLLLSHVPGPNGCVRVGSRRVKTSSNPHGPLSERVLNADTTPNGIYGKYQGPSGIHHVGPDGLEEVPEYICADSCAIRALDEQSGVCRSSGHVNISESQASPNKSVAFGQKSHDRAIPNVNTYSDKGGASRFFVNFSPDPNPGFFYQAKASKKDRSANGTVENTHSTVKPTALMKYLVRLISPPGGTVLDPFCGSGTTGVACVELGYNFVGIELDSSYADIAEKRIFYHSLPEAERVEIPTPKEVEKRTEELWEDKRTGPEPDDLTYGEVIEKFATALAKTEEQFKDKLF